MKDDCNEIDEKILSKENLVTVCNFFKILIVFIVVSFPSIVTAKINGKVIDQFGRGLNQVHVEIVNTGFEADTDENGSYSIDYVPGKIKLKYSKPRYTTQHLEFDIYTKDNFPASKVEMWEIPAEGIYLVDRNQKKYIPVPPGFSIEGKRKRHRDPNSLDNLRDISNLAALVFSANYAGNFPVENGQIEVIDTIPKSVRLYKRGADNTVLSLQEGAFGKIGGVFFDGMIPDKTRAIGDEQLTVRIFEGKDGVYLYTEVKTDQDGFGTKVMTPVGVYYPLIVGKPAHGENTFQSGKAGTLSLTKKQKEKMALQLVTETLESGRTNSEKTVSRNSKVLIGVTPTGTYKFQNQYPCRNYKVISYETGKAVVMARNAKACRVGDPPKWYPAYMLEHPSKKGISRKKFSAEMVGTGW